jgi:rRNA small subunit methyltransferase G
MVPLLKLLLLMMMILRHQSFFVICLCSHLMISRTVFAFPSHFTETGIGCMTELDETEVIMNNKVIPYAQSSDQSMYIDLRSTEPVTVGSTVNLVFRNPKSRPDVMYVIEASEGARFVDGRCDHEKRVGGKAQTVAVVHSLIIDTLPVHVWGGWATGHEAVQLTPVLTLGLDMEDFAANISDAIQKVKDMQEAEMHEREEVAEELGDDDQANLGDLSHQLEEGLKEKVENAHDVVQEKMEKMAKLANLGLGLTLPINHKTLENIRSWTSKLHASQDKMQLLKERDKEATILDKEEKKKNYLERMKERLDPEKYELMKDRIEQQFDRRDTHRTARHKVRPLHELKELQESMDEHLEQEAQKNVPHTLRERWESFHRNDKRWAERFARAGHENETEAYREEQVASERADDDPTPLTRFRQFLHHYDQHREIDMQQFLYAVIFFVLANIILIQSCLWIGRREKGRREL